MIKVENVTKYYGKRLAVDNISFSVKKGEIVGFVGPNGAGKTTTMRMLTGFLAPNDGEVEIAGHDMLRHSLEARRYVGYLPESIPLYTDITVRSYLEFAARLRGLEPARVKDRIDAVVSLCHLEEYVDSIIGKLSKGFRQRVGVAQAIIHEPQVLILDEPTIGIDPLQVAMTRQLIRDLGKDRTVLFSTHILTEVSTVCERVIVMHQGKIVAQDRIEKLATILQGGRRLRIEISGPAEQVASRLRKVDGVTQVSTKGSRHVVECSGAQDPRAAIMQAMVESGWTVLSLEALAMSLEDVFLKLIARQEAKQ